MEKNNKGTMTKIKNRRTIIAVILLLPLIIVILMYLIK